MPMAGDSDTDFNVLRHTFKGGRTAGCMDHSGIGFPLRRIDRGKGVHVAVGTQGELARLNDAGEVTTPISRPFPAPIIDGITLEDRWVGIWLEREFREARMAALPLDGEWLDGPGRDDLRLSSIISEEVHPPDTIWHRILDTEPMKLGRLSGNIVFSTLGGVYMIDPDANEKWRAQLPLWTEISEMGVQDMIVSILEIPGGVSVWSQAGGVAVLDHVDGSLIYSRVLNLGDKVVNTVFSKDGGWLVMLHGGSIALLDQIEGTPKILRNIGPVMDSQFIEGEWRWTGWRHDGRLTKDGIKSVRRDSIGVAMLNGTVFTNDGMWSDYSA